MLVLIASAPHDVHAMATRWALSRMNVNCEIIFTGDLTTQAKLDYVNNDDGDSTWIWKDVKLGQTIDLHKADVFWNRRVVAPIIPENVHEADRLYVDRNFVVTWHAVEQFLSRNSIPVNHCIAKSEISAKSYQLDIARECGLAIPRTLISSDPDAVGKFFDENKDTGTIMKSQVPMFWQVDGKFHSAYTTKLTKADVENSAAIDLCPMIFQQCIEKTCEYRLVVFGASYWLFKIDSQSSSYTSTDWRVLDSGALNISLIETPEKLRASIRSFLEKSNLLMGIFDLAETPDGEFVFFEVNEQGQFLFLEEACKDSGLFDGFLHFVKNPSRDFVYTPNDEVITYELFLENVDLEAMRKEELSRHAKYNKEWTVNEQIA